MRSPPHWRFAWARIRVAEKPLGDAHARAIELDLERRVVLPELALQRSFRHAHQGVTRTREEMRVMDEHVAEGLDAGSVRRSRRRRFYGTSPADRASFAVGVAIRDGGRVADLGTRKGLGRALRS
jgi:hypothetical protein